MKDKTWTLVPKTAKRSLGLFKNPSGKILLYGNADYLIVRGKRIRAGSLPIINEGDKLNWPTFLQSMTELGYVVPEEALPMSIPYVIDRLEEFC